MSEELYEEISAHAIEEINRLNGLLVNVKDERNFLNNMTGFATFVGLELFKDEPERNEQLKLKLDYSKAIIKIVTLKITIWTQVIEGAKNPKMLDLFNEALNEFIMAGWAYGGQAKIVEEGEEAKLEYEMFKRVLGAIPDKKKKTRRGGKKHKKKPSPFDEVM